MSQPTRVIVIGGGPIGLEAAAYGRAAGLDVVLYERKDIGAHVNAWAFVRMFTPWHLNTTPLGREAVGNDPVLSSCLCPTGQELVQQYLVPLAESDLLRDSVETGVRVLAVGRDERPTGTTRGAPRFRVLLCDGYGREQLDYADVVLDCSGTYGNRRWLGQSGIPAVGEVGLSSAIWYVVPDVLGVDRASFEHRRTLLVGAGTSALTVLSHLALLAAESPGTRVTWVLRRWGEVLSLADEDPLPQRRALAEAALRLLARPPGWLDVLEDATIERLDGSHGLQVWLRSKETVVHRQVDEMVAAIGFRPDETMFEPLGVRPTYGDVAMTRTALDAGDLAVDDSCGRMVQSPPVPAAGPGYFLLGHKSFGTNPNFLLRAGHRQIRDVYRKLMNDPTIDLYAGHTRAVIDGMRGACGETKVNSAACQA